MAFHQCPWGPGVAHRSPGELVWTNTGADNKFLIINRRCNIFYHNLTQLGTIFIFPAVGLQKDEEYVAAGILTHPLLVEWIMLFRCPLLHPTVMFRRAVVLECGAYTNQQHVVTPTDTDAEDSDAGSQFKPDEEITVIEDYSLWSRVLARCGEADPDSGLLL